MKNFAHIHSLSKFDLYNPFIENNSLTLKNVIKIIFKFNNILYIHKI